METENLIPGSWYSRDFELTMVCRNKDCYLNDRMGKCVAPSAVTIDDVGKCERYMNELNKRKASDTNEMYKRKNI